ncbi:MAG: acyl carrier protein [Burkholderiaceae bacterium]|nr:acyl carrier protein [Burkholderiaceae bacterium]
MQAVREDLTLAEALVMLGDCFGESASALSPQRERESIPGWDSMGALMLMAELDERFGIELDAETSRAMTTVAQALAFMRERGALAG